MSLSSTPSEFLAAVRSNRRHFEAIRSVVWSYTPLVTRVQTTSRPVEEGDAELRDQVSALVREIVSLKKENRILSEDASTVRETTALLKEKCGALETIMREHEACKRELSDRESDYSELIKKYKALEDNVFEQQVRNAKVVNDLNEENSTLRRDFRRALVRLRSMEVGDGDHGDIDAGMNDNDDRLDALMSSFPGQSSLRVVPPTVHTRSVSAHDSEINCIAISPSGDSFATGSNDKTVKLWEPKTFQPLAVLQGSNQAVLCLAFSEVGDIILGAGADAACRVWNVQNNRIRHTMTGHTGKIHGISVAMDGKTAVTGSHDRTLKIWDLSKGFVSRTIMCFSSCNDVSIVQGDDVIVSGHFDGSLRLWDAKSGSSVEEVKDAHTAQVTSVTPSPDGSLILSNSRDNSLKLFDLRMYNVIQTFTSPQYKNGLNWNKACFSPDGSFVAAGSSGGHLVVWNTRTGKTVASLSGHSKPISGTCWHPDGSMLMTSSIDHTCGIWR